MAVFVTSGMDRLLYGRQCMHDSCKCGSQRHDPRPFMDCLRRDQGVAGRQRGAHAISPELHIFSVVQSYSSIAAVTYFVAQNDRPGLFPAAKMVIMSQQAD